MMTRDAFAARQQEIAEQVAAGERAHRKNVELFQQMWLSLGSDVTKLEGTRHDAELAEAKGIAAARWNQLLGLEAQIVREEQQLALRPKNRPISSTDDTLPDRFLEKQEQEWQEKTKYLHAAHAELKEQAKAERKELESFVTKRE
jgi:hypothetical protein